jgi:hypothetical protein
LGPAGTCSLTPALSDRPEDRHNNYKGSDEEDSDQRGTPGARGRGGTLQGAGRGVPLAIPRTERLSWPIVCEVALGEGRVWPGVGTNVPLGIGEGTLPIRVRLGMAHEAISSPTGGAARRGPIGELAFCW